VELVAWWSAYAVVRGAFDSGWGVLYGIAAAGLAIAIWAGLAAPRTPTRLRQPWLAVFKLVYFTAATLAVWSAADLAFALAFAGAALVAVVLEAGVGLLADGAESRIEP
jgi:hypothetical protein